MVIYDKTQKNLTIPNAFIKSVEGGSAVAGVKSINGLTGDLTIKSINGENIVEEGNIELSKAYGFDYVEEGELIYVDWGRYTSINPDVLYKVIHIEDRSDKSHLFYNDGAQRDVEVGEWLPENTYKIMAAGPIRIQGFIKKYNFIPEIAEMNDDDIEELKSIFDEPVPPEPVPPYYYIVNPIGELE